MNWKNKLRQNTQKWAKTLIGSIFHIFQPRIEFVFSLPTPFCFHFACNNPYSFISKMYKNAWNMSKMFCARVIAGKFHRKLGYIALQVMQQHFVCSGYFWCGAEKMKGKKIWKENNFIPLIRFFPHPSAMANLVDCNKKEHYTYNFIMKVFNWLPSEWDLFIFVRRYIPSCSRSERGVMVSVSGKWIAEMAFLPYLKSLILNLRQLLPDPLSHNDDVKIRHAVILTPLPTSCKQTENKTHTKLNLIISPMGFLIKSDMNEWMNAYTV